LHEVDVASWRKAWDYWLKSKSNGFKRDVGEGEGSIKASNQNVLGFV
jgi:hypothetical protein